MNKRAVSIGNSVGLVIDRALCKILGIRRGTTLHIFLDGRRLVVEPVFDAANDEPPKEEKPVMDPVMRKRLIELFLGLGVDQPTFDRLYHKAYKPILYGVDVELRMLKLSDPDEALSFRRFYAFYEALAEKKEWGQAADDALRTVPMR